VNELIFLASFQAATSKLWR